MTTPQMTFRDEVKHVVEAQQAEALDQVGVMARQAISDVIRQLLGARWDSFHDKWEFQNLPRRGDLPGSAMFDAVTAKANRLAHDLVEEALKEPIVFTKSDLTKLRASLKDAVLAAADELLAERARQIASEMIEAMQ